MKALERKFETQNPLWTRRDILQQCARLVSIAFFMFRKEVFTVHNRRIGFKPYIQEVSGIEAVDIDEKKDYELACKLAEAEKIENE